MAADDRKYYVPISYDPFRIVGEIEHFEPVDETTQQFLQYFQNDPHGLSAQMETCRITFSARLDLRLLTDAYRDFSRQQSWLRAIFSADHKSVMFCHLDRVEIRFTDLSAFTDDRLLENCCDFEVRMRDEVFDIYNGPLLRLHLLQLGPDQSRLLVAAHALLANQVSLQALLAQLGQSYSRLLLDGQLVTAVNERRPSSLINDGGLANSWPVPIESFLTLVATNEQRKADEKPAKLQPWSAPTETEQQLIKIWQEILGVDHVGLDENFFELGGQSIQAATVLTRLQKRFDQRLSLREFQFAPTIRAMAALLSGSQQPEAEAKTSLSDLREPEVRARIDLDEFVRTEFSFVPEPLELCTDFPRPASCQQGLVSIHKDLSASDWRSLSDLCHRQNLPIEQFLLGQYLTLLGRYSNQCDMVCMLHSSEPKIDAPLCFHFNLETSLQNHLQAISEHLNRWPDGLFIEPEILAEALRLEKDPSRSLVGTVGFVIAQDDPMVGAEKHQRLSPPLDLCLVVQQSQDRLRLVLEYRPDLFEQSSMQSLLSALCQLCLIDEASLDIPIGRLDLLSEQEKKRILIEHNQTERAFKGPSFLHQLIETASLQNPQRTAIIFGDRQLSYLSLNERANRIAHYLIQEGVRVGDIVGISMYRSPEMVMAMLAILKAGATYMPMDPDYPSERLDYMLENSKTRFVLTERTVVSHLPLRSARALVIDELDEHILTFSSESPLIPDLTPSSLAYVIYTSGSTGKPKGVAISHRAVVNFLHALEYEVHLNERDRLLAVTTISFDISVLEIFSTLKAGATLVLMGQESAMDADELQEAISRHDITVMQATPATWRLLLEAGWQGKSDLTIICGGEAFPRDLARRLVPVVRKVWNAYGPTEATVWASLFHISNPEHAILIGKPMANYTTYILDEHLQAVPQGMAGHLYLGGQSLAEGYLNRLDLTSERFINHPFVPDQKIYDTGDVARYRGDLNLEYLSRRDNQVKIRGFRIELGEIEAMVSTLEQVRQAVVIVREDDPGDKRLVCYVLLRDGAALHKSDLDRHLEKSLPDYMIPNHLVVLEQIPLTGSGKVDRKALPLPREGSKEVPREVSSDDEELPSTDMEKGIAEIWAALLGVDYITVHDNFFDLGGHSLLAIKAVKAMSSLSKQKIGMRDLLTNTLGQIAAQMET